MFISRRVGIGRTSIRIWVIPVNSVKGFSVRVTTEKVEVEGKKEDNVSNHNSLDENCRTFILMSEQKKKSMTMKKIKKVMMTKTHTWTMTTTRMNT